MRTTDTRSVLYGILVFNQFIIRSTIINEDAILKVKKLQKTNAVRIRCQFWCPTHVSAQSLILSIVRISKIVYRLEGNVVFPSLRVWEGGKKERDEKKLWDLSPKLTDLISIVRRLVDFS